MHVHPAKPDFAATYEAGRPQVLYATLTADLETPVSAMLKLADGRSNAFLLESVEGGRSRGRYSIIGLKPDLIWRMRGGRAEINCGVRHDPDGFIPCEEDPLPALRRLIAESRIDLPPELPPMASGLFGYMGFACVRLMERLPNTAPDPLGLPDAVLLRPTIIVVFDSVTGDAAVVTPVWPEEGRAAAEAYDRGAERLLDVLSEFERTVSASAARDETSPLPDGDAITSNTSKADYLTTVERAKEYIRAGDIYQVVPSQRFSADFDLPPFALYRALRRLNPSPFLFYLNFDGYAIVGSSPELLVRLRNDTVTIRPIAGTRPRGATAAEDRALADDLLADEKERAEHLMLLDLARNDVGRVARTGSVTVTEQFVIEPYSHVMHIVSNVEGKLAPDHDAVSALLAGFPAGTVSGAPKIRAMEIITELEPHARGVYGGMIGYFAADGGMDNCIALRTAVVKDGRLYVQAGGGVVADSDPEAEYQETVNKAQALFRAAAEAHRFAPKR